MKYTNGVEATVGDMVIDADGIVGKLVEISPNGSHGNVLRIRTVPLSGCTRIVDSQIEGRPSVRAKFRVRSLSPSEAPEGGGSVRLDPVTCGSPENDRFYRLTPGGEISLSTINETAFNRFKPGIEYYVDFTPCEQVVSPPITENTICVGSSPAPAQPPIDNAHVAEGCEKFSEPTAEGTLSTGPFPHSV